MLKLAAQYRDLLESEGIDPEEVVNIELTHDKPGYLKISLQPKVQYIQIDVRKKGL